MNMISAEMLEKVAMETDAVAMELRDVTIPNRAKEICNRLGLESGAEFNAVQAYLRARIRIKTGPRKTKSNNGLAAVR